MTRFASSLTNLLATLTFFFAIIEVCSSIQNVRLILPTFVHADTTATLLCLYDLEGASLYSIQWYRGQFEFFRFVPKEKPERKAFPIPGLDVDVHASNAHQVTLRNIPARVSGEFTCEITTDAPRFRTCRASSNLTVVGLDLNVVVPKRNFRYGDIIEAKCTLTPHLPNTKLKFYWNVTPIPDEFVQSDGSNSIGLMLKSSGFLLETEMSISVRLTCSAVLDSTYYIISKSVSFQLEPRNPSEPSSGAERLKNKAFTETLICFLITSILNFSFTVVQC